MAQSARCMGEALYIKTLVTDQWLDSILEEVLYVPFNKNLFPVDACNKNYEYKAVFKNDSV